AVVVVLLPAATDWLAETAPPSRMTPLVAQVATCPWVTEPDCWTVWASTGVAQISRPRRSAHSTKRFTASTTARSRYPRARTVQTARAPRLAACQDLESIARGRRQGKP